MSDSDVMKRLIERALYDKRKMLLWDDTDSPAIKVLPSGEEIVVNLEYLYPFPLSFKRCLKDIGWARCAAQSVAERFHDAIPYHQKLIMSVAIKGKGDECWVTVNYGYLD